MTRKRVAGRFAREGEGAPADGTGRGAAGKRVYASRSVHSLLIGRTRKRLMEAIPSIVNTLLEKAETGSVPHMKLLLELSGLDKGRLAPRQEERREKTLEEILMEQWRNEPKYGPGLEPERDEHQSAGG